jgi:glycosyltransferase involved in cell wall biosynthesis
LAVVPSYSDGLAYSVVEPLLGGVPVVATNAGGIPDLVRDGDTGWLVPIGNPSALARAMREALDHPAEARRRAVEGSKLARNLMDLKTAGQEVASAYNKILTCSIN